LKPNSAAKAAITSAKFPSAHDHLGSHLNVIPGQAPAFEATFGRAIPILAGARGYINHELRRVIENPNR
jgi:heme-degrading monooxygenase HmoA